MGLLKDTAISDRPRERLERNGTYVLSDTELIAVILGSGSKDEDVMALSGRLVRTYGIKGLSGLGFNGLKENKGIGPARASLISACFELGKRASANNKTRKQITCARDVFEMVKSELTDISKETLLGIYLDTRKKVIKKEVITIGTLDLNLMPPRDIFKTGLLESAAAIILVHNHPSGDPEPSVEDIESTKEIAKAGRMIGIELLDHVIVGRQGYVSLKEREII